MSLPLQGSDKGGGLVDQISNLPSAKPTVARTPAIDLGTKANATITTRRGKRNTIRDMRLKEIIRIGVWNILSWNTKKAERY